VLCRSRTRSVHGCEPVDVRDVTDQAGRAGRADAVQVLQAAAGRQHELAEFLVRGPGLLVDLDQFGDQLRGEPATGAPDQIHGDGSC